MKNKVTCDQCEKDFIIVDKQRKHPKGIIESYFTCPHCNKEYTFLVTDKALRIEQETIKKLHEQYIKRKGKAMERTEQLKTQLEANKVIDDSMDSIDEMLDDLKPVE